MLLFAALAFGGWLAVEPIKIYRAKVWCEELVALMLRDRELVEEDPGHFGVLHDEIRWYPLALMDEHSFGWTFLDEGMEFEFGTDAGTFHYNSVTGDWSTSGPTRMVAATPVNPGD